MKWNIEHTHTNWFQTRISNTNIKLRIWNDKLTTQIMHLKWNTCSQTQSIRILLTSLLLTNCSQHIIPQGFYLLYNTTGTTLASSINEQSKCQLLQSKLLLTTCSNIISWKFRNSILNNIFLKCIKSISGPPDLQLANPTYITKYPAPWRHLARQYPSDSTFLHSLKFNSFNLQHDFHNPNTEKFCDPTMAHQEFHLLNLLENILSFSTLWCNNKFSCLGRNCQMKQKITIFLKIFFISVSN